MQMLSNTTPQRIVERVLAAAGHVIMNEGSKSTIRAAARFVNASIGTVHRDLTIRLRDINPFLYQQVKFKLERNKNERHLRGGETTRKRYSLSESEKLYRKIIRFTSNKYSEIPYLGDGSYEEHVQFMCRTLNELGYPVEYLIIARLVGLMEYCKFGFNNLCDLYGREIADILNRYDRKQNQHIIRYLRRLRVSNVCLTVKLIDILGRLEKMAAVADKDIELPGAKEYFLEVVTYYHSMFESSQLFNRYLKVVDELRNRFKMRNIESEVLQYLSDKYNFDCIVFGKNEIEVYSKYDKWKIMWIDGFTLRLLHRNRFNKRGYHTQHDFSVERCDATMAHAFLWINNHDVYREKQISEEGLK